MHVRHFLAGALLAAALSSGRGEDAPSTDSHVAKAYEDWGDAWFRREGEPNEPEMFVRITSSLEKSETGKLPTVLVESRLTTGSGILTHRSTLHFDSSPMPIVLYAVESTIDDSVLESFQLTFRSTSVTSEVRVCLGCSQSARSEFAREHTWDADSGGTATHADRVFKDVELMALKGTKARELKVLVGRVFRDLTIRQVEDAEVEFEGKALPTRVFEVSRNGEESCDTYWVSPDRGLLQFRRQGSPLFRRISPKAATDALLKAERKARGWDEDTYPNPNAAAIEIRIRLTTDDGVKVKTAVSGRDAADAAAVETCLLEDVKAAKATGESWVVLIDADPKVPWKDVIAIMDVCKKNDVTRVELAAPRRSR